jgi:hypothetical protein
LTFHNKLLANSSTPQKRGQKSETAPGGWLAADVACMAGIGRSGGQQPVIMDSSMTLYYEQQLS